MALKFAEQCCDAVGYLELGRVCVKNINACWDPMRTIGATLYYSVPFFFGWPPETIIVFNFILMGLAVYSATRVVFNFLEARIQHAYRAWLVAAGIAVVPHVLFMWGCARHSLTDVPAGSLILIGLWSLVNAVQKKTYAQAYSGLFFSMAALMRPFYLYLALMVMVVYSVFQGVKLKAKAIKPIVTFMLCILIPLGFQYYLTYNNTKHWSFVDRDLQEKCLRGSMKFECYGYDTILPGTSYLFTDPYTSNGTGGLVNAVARHDWKRAAILFAKKENFYFGSWVPFNYVYLRSPQDRIFSPFILMVNLLMMGGCIYFLWIKRHWQVLFIPALAAGMIWAQCVLIHAEARYMIVVYVFVWIIAALNIERLFKKNPHA